MELAHFDVADDLDLRSTVKGAKTPVTVGPGESWWSTRTPDGPGTLQLTRRSATSIEAAAWGPGAGWLLAQTPALLGERDDLDGFTPPRPLLDLWRRRPFRLARTDRPWDALVGAVFGQKVQTFHATRSRRALARRFGERAPGPRTAWLLPPPERVARLGYADFHRLGVERKRAESLIRAARELVRCDEFAGWEPADAVARLETVRGIGPWTTALVAATAWGDPDAVPVGDYHLPNTVAWALAREARATDERMLELLEPHAGHRWRVVRLAKASGSAPKYGPRLGLRGDGLHLGS
ncbi:MAG: DNA-3-methyladenine glycosylase family protein [Acidimicrobiales bacterium]